MTLDEMIELGEKGFNKVKLAKLGKMGFTDEEIFKLAGTAKTPEVKDPEPKPEENNLTEVLNAISALTEKVNAMEENVINNNLNFRMPDQQSDVDSIIANIINPKTNEEV